MSKKSKKKKHKKEKRRLSSEKEDLKKHGATEGKHRHGHHLSHVEDKQRSEKHTDCSPSPRKGSPKKDREYKKAIYRLDTCAPADGTKGRRKEEEDGKKKHSGSSSNTLTQDSSSRTPSGSEKSLSKSASSAVRDGPTWMPLCLRKCTSIGAGAGRTSHSSGKASPRQASAGLTVHEATSAELQEQRRRLVKRRLKHEEAAPEGQSTPGSPLSGSLSQELREKRRRLESRGSREEDKAVLERKRLSQAKGVSDHSKDPTKVPHSTSAKSPTSQATSNVSKQATQRTAISKQPERCDSVRGAASGENPSSYPPLSVSFKIPKKSSTMQVRRTGTDIWDLSTDGEESTAVSKVMGGPPADKAAISASPQQTREKLPKASFSVRVFSPLPKPSQVLEEAQVVNARETSLPRNTSTSVRETTLARITSASARETSLPRNISASVRETTLARNISASARETTLARNISASARETSLPRNTSTSVRETTLARITSASARETSLPRNISASVRETTLARNISASARETSLPRNISASVRETTLARNISASARETSLPRNISASVSETTLARNISASARETSLPRNISASVRETTLASNTSVSTTNMTLASSTSASAAEMTLASNTSSWTSQTITTGVSPEKTEICDNDQEMQLVEELHLARSNRQLEVNVVESYGELTCMDIDPPEEGATPTLSKELVEQDLLIVMDTNILISHLDYVKKMRSHGLGALGFPTVLIPWVVLQELDALKNGKLSSKVGQQAKPAVHYIYTCLKSQEPRLWGQSMQQAAQAVYGLKAENNDDRVLQCCLQYQSLYPGGALILCTNDKNLCSKALLSGVKALSKVDLQGEVDRLRPGQLNHSQGYDLHSAGPTAGPGETAEERSRQEQRSTEERREAAAEARELSVCVALLEKSLQGALSVVLEHEMKAAYGDLWAEIVVLKPPWTLADLLLCFRKHWIAVFGNVVKRSLLSCVDVLSDCLCSGKAVERSSVLCAVGEAVELLSALGYRSDYTHVPQALSSLQALQLRLQPPSTAVGDSDGDTLMAEEEEWVAPPPQASDQEVWAVFENIWTNVCHTSSAVFSALRFVPGSVETTLPADAPPPPQDALSCLHRLSAAVRHLLEAFHRVLSADSIVEDAQALLTFIQTSEIAAMEPRFTAKDLFQCLSQQEYREKLCVGGAQLSELSGSLEHCVAAVGVRAWT